MLMAELYGGCACREWVIIVSKQRKEKKRFEQQGQMHLLLKMTPAIHYADHDEGDQQDCFMLIHDGNDKIHDL